MARLTAFYGLDPWRLIAELPLRVVRALSRMLPRLQAERSFEAADQVAVGINAAFAEGYTKGPVHRWQDAIQPAGDQPVARATTQQLQRVGIGVRIVKPGAADAR